MPWKVLFILAYLCVLSFANAACRCEKKHIQEHFCLSDFVVNATFSTRRDGLQHSRFSSIIYNVAIENIYKASPEAAEVLKLGELETGSNSLSCGVTWIKPGTSLLVSGYYEPSSRRAHFSTCGLLLANPSPNQLQNLIKGYKKGCDICQIASCSVDCSGTGMPVTTCPWNKSWILEDCQDRYSACVPSPSAPKLCQWEQSLAYKTCISPNK